MTCQSCQSSDLEPVLSLGLHPLPNRFRSTDAPPAPVTYFPLNLVRCAECTLVQLDYVPAPELVFPTSYLYTSGTTKQLRDNFADLAREVMVLQPLEAPDGAIAGSGDLVVDIGSNDGTLLSNFVGSARVLGVTPEDVGQSAAVPTVQAYFTEGLGLLLLCERGPARIVTCTNCFAHVPDPNDFLRGVLALTKEDGVFVSEHTYWLDTVRTGAYDSVYSEHARFYTLGSLIPLLEQNGLEVFDVRRIPTHGGSIRVYAAWKGKRAIEPSVREMLDEERGVLTVGALAMFARRVNQHRRELSNLLRSCFVDCLSETALQSFTIHGIGAPSRASTLINYCGITADELSVIYETAGSGKIGKCIPGTSIRVEAEPERFGEEQPTHLLLLSWHLHDLPAKLRAKGFRGKFIRPLPEIEVIP